MNEETSSPKGLTPKIAQLVESNLGLAWSIAASYQKTLPSVDHADLAAEAVLGLVKAAKGFDESRKVPFAAYASQSIRNQLNSLYRKEIEYREKEKMVLDLSGKTEIGEDDESEKNRVPETSVNPDRQAHRNEVSQILSQEVEALAGRQKEIIQSISQGESYAEIARRMNVSKQAVHKAGKLALEQLRRQVESHGIYKVRFQDAVEEDSADSGEDKEQPLS